MISNNNIQFYSIGGGELLSRVVDEDYVLTERECVHFMRQICDGVKFIHEQNIVHLDLKPENVMCITKNSNEIKIIDFGLARKLDLNKDNKVLIVWEFHCSHNWGVCCIIHVCLNEGII